MYSTTDLVRIAKRENNKKRSFLIVNPLQGKHIPTSPNNSIHLFHHLSKKLKDYYKDENIIIIGFAETATAISSQVAIDLNCNFILTTRESYKDEEYLYFSEEHSHATEQKLIKKDLVKMITNSDRIIFIDDEISSGKTILNLIAAFKNNFKVLPNFSVASLINGMSKENLDIYKDYNINVHYIIKSNQKKYTAIADSINAKNDNLSYVLANKNEKSLISIKYFHGYINPRYITNSKTYEKQVHIFWEEFHKNFQIHENETVLVLGTEEFMYPAMYIAKHIEDLNINTKFHATTRSPIIVSYDENYPLHTRYQVPSLYDSKRTTYIYNLTKYDYIFIITDSTQLPEESLSSIYSILKDKSPQINLIVWKI